MTMSACGHLISISRNFTFLQETIDFILVDMASCNSLLFVFKPHSRQNNLAFAVFHLMKKFCPLRSYSERLAIAGQEA